MQDTFAFGQGSLAWLERNDLLTRGKMATYIRRGYTAARSHHDSLLVYGPDSSLQGEIKYKPGSQEPFRKVLHAPELFENKNSERVHLASYPNRPWEYETVGSLVQQVITPGAKAMVQEIPSKATWVPILLALWGQHVRWQGRT